MLSCNVKFSLFSFFPNMLHVSVYCLYLCLHLLLHLYLNWCGGYITVQAGRPREGIWRIGWFAGVERTREPLLYCTVLAAVPGRRPRRAHQGSTSVRTTVSGSASYRSLPLISRGHLGFLGFSGDIKGIVE